MTDQYVRYADWLTFSWIVMLAGACLVLLGVEGFLTALLAVETGTDAPFVAASEAIVPQTLKIFVGGIGLFVFLAGREARSEADAIMPDGLEVPGA